MTDKCDPIKQISEKNPWYVDDHFSKQYKRPGPRAVIENRWKIFGRVLTEFLQSSHTASSTRPIRILDAGCGDGINLFGLGNMVQGQEWNAHFFATDYNPLRIERATKFSFVKNICQSSLDALPYSGGLFDLVLCSQVLEHIPQDKKVLQELKRVIRPGGILILGVPNEGCFLGWLRNHVIQRSILRTTDHVNFYTEQSISSLLDSVGFPIVKIEKAGFFFPHLALHHLLSFVAPGRRLIQILGKVWESQSAELSSL